MKRVLIALMLIMPIIAFAEEDYGETQGLKLFFSKTVGRGEKFL